MDRQYIDDHHIVARYLADQLTEDERAAFEAYFLEHPEILREIEATARFKAGLAQLQASGELAALMKPAPWYTQWRYLAVAAVVILIIGVVFYVPRPTRPVMAATLAALDGPTTIGGSYTVLRRRGSPFDAEITLSALGAPIELRVLPEFAAPGASYRIALARVDDDKKERLAEIDDLSASADGMVAVYLDGRGFAPGDYEVTIANDAAADSDQTSRFLIRVSR